MSRIRQSISLAASAGQKCAITHAHAHARAHARARARAHAHAHAHTHAHAHERTHTHICSQTHTEAGGAIGWPHPHQYIQRHTHTHTEAGGGVSRPPGLSRPDNSRLYREAHGHHSRTQQQKHDSIQVVISLDNFAHLVLFLSPPLSASHA